MLFINVSSMTSTIHIKSPARHVIRWPIESRLLLAAVALCSLVVFKTKSVSDTVSLRDCSTVFLTEAFHAPNLRHLTGFLPLYSVRMAHLPQVVTDSNLEVHREPDDYLQPRRASFQYQKEVITRSSKAQGRRACPILSGGRFWGLTVLAIVIIVAAVAGGVGGSIAVQRAKSVLYIWTCRLHNNYATGRGRIQKLRSKSQSLLQNLQPQQRPRH